MRWVFYSLVVLNLVYLGWQLTLGGHKQPVEAAVPAAQHGARLQLLSESAQRRRQAEPLRAAGAKQGLCPVVGPWASREEAGRAAIQLEAAGLRAHIRAVTMQKDHLNWVYLPAYDSRARALEVLGELQSRGVDSFVVKEGEDANAVSLGYFSSADSAEGLRIKMRNAGYPAFVRETSRPVTEYWLYLPMAQAESPALEDFLVGNPTVIRDRAACTGGSGSAG